MSRPLPVPGALVAAAAVALTLPPARANLFDPSHAEWGPADHRVEFQRAFRVQLRWRL